MTDISKYRNVSLTHTTYNTLVRLSKTLLPDAKLSIRKTVEAIANEKDKLTGNSYYAAMGKKGGRPRMYNHV